MRTSGTAATLGDPAGAGGRPGLWLQVLGLVLIGVGPLLSAVVDLAVSGRLGLGSLAAAVPIVAVVATVALLVRRGSGWAVALGMVVGAVDVAALAGVAVRNLRFADSVLDFLPLITSWTGGVVAVAAGLVALLRPRVAADGPSPAERRTGSLILAALAVLAVGSVVATIAGTERVDVALARFAVRVDAVGFVFEPAVVEVDAQDPLIVHNADPVLHTFTIPSLGIDHAIRPGSDALIDLSAVAPGIYTFYCKPHADTRIASPTEAGMAGSLIVP